MLALKVTLFTVSASTQFLVADVWPTRLSVELNFSSSFEGESYGRFVSLIGD